MPLWTIFTKWPAPSSPTQSQQGRPSVFAAIGLEDLLHQGPRARIAARHDGRAVPRALFSAGDSRADEQEALLREGFRPPDRVGKMRVAAVDDAVPGLQVRKQLIDGLVHGFPGLHQQHHAPRPLQSRGRAPQACALPGSWRGRAPRCARNLSIVVGGPVEDDDRVAVIVDVEDQVLSHDGKADQSRNPRVAPLRDSLSAETRARRPEAGRGIGNVEDALAVGKLVPAVAKAARVVARAHRRKVPEPEPRLLHLLAGSDPRGSR